MGFVLRWNYTHANSLDITEKGLFGDMFGASNALFTGLSFTGVIIAILLQRQELKLQRNELELTREEMKLTKMEFNQQNETLTKQQFENTFFQMLSMLHTNIRSINISLNGNNVSGNQIFTSFKNEIKVDVDNKTRDRVQKKDVNLNEFGNQLNIERLNFSTEDLKAIFQSKFRVYENLLTNYFSSLFVILKFVDESLMIDKQFYISVIRSQFSRDELYVLFLKTISLMEEDEMRKLIDKYNIFDDLDLKLLVNRDVFSNYLAAKNKRDFMTLS